MCVQAKDIRERHAYKKKDVKLNVEEKVISREDRGRGSNERQTGRNMKQWVTTNLSFSGIILPPSVLAQNNICCHSAVAMCERSRPYVPYLFYKQY